MSQDILYFLQLLQEISFKIKDLKNKLKHMIGQYKFFSLNIIQIDAVIYIFHSPS